MVNFEVDLAVVGFCGDFEVELDFEVDLNVVDFDVVAFDVVAFDVVVVDVLIVVISDVNVTESLTAFDNS